MHQRPALWGQKRHVRVGRSSLQACLLVMQGRDALDLNQGREAYADLVRLRLGHQHHPDVLNAVRCVVEALAGDKAGALNLHL